MTAHALPRWLSASLLLLIATTFASNHVAARVAFDHGANVATAVAVRSSGAALFVFALLRAANIPLSLARPTLVRALGIGALLSIQSLCLYSAVARIPVALALLVFNTFPMMLGLLAWATGSGRPRPRAFVAMALALSGLGLALDAFGWSGQAAHADDAAMSSGVALAAIAALAFAAVLLLTTRWLGDTDGRLRSFVLMIVVASVALVAGKTSGDFAWPQDATGWIALALLTLLYSSAITALFVLLPRLGAVNNAAVMNFEPIAALLLGWVLLDQTMAPLQLLGAGIVVCAIVLLVTTRSPT
ncbi:MAG: DMT family transporter [Burkholderiaceae bacterium]|jgi:drug/metabolite transporter (DMT)-like permease|nr:DMT family transporter [Burkholderiaceae bacterium]